MYGGTRINMDKRVGSKFLSRGDDNVKNEVTIKYQLLNKIFEIGKPISVRVA